MSTAPTDTAEQQSEQPQPPEEPTLDIVTLLQKKLIHQSFSIYNFLGALQQLAPPQPFIVDELLRPSSEHPEWGAITDTPKVLREQMQNIQELIDQLPPLQEEDEVMEEILSLLEQNNQLDKELATQLTKAEDVLYEGHLSSSALSLHELKAATSDKARMEENSAEPGSSAMQT